MWNWKLNQTHYPTWNSLRESLAVDGVKTLLYMNPYLEVNCEMFSHAVANNFLVKNPQGLTYTQHAYGKEFAMIDLTNDAARAWVKTIIKQNIIEETGASGWIHDLGQHLPYDARLFDTSHPLEYHTRYLEDWAEVAYETMIEGGLTYAEHISYFMSAASSNSPQLSSLLNTGVLEASFDGMQKALRGQLNAGLSGYTLI